MNVSVAIAIRIIKQLTGDHRTVGMIIFIPVIITFVFGYAFQGWSTIPENLDISRLSTFFKSVLEAAIII